MPAAEYMAGHTSYVRREPVGVCAAVTPWNYPMMMAVWKWAPALAAGNTMVLKPSDTTPVSTLLLAEILARALPARRVQRRLRRPRHRAGRSSRIRPRRWSRSPAACGPAWRSPTAAAADLKRVHLELGGKAPVIVFDDADLAATAEGIAGAAYFNAGQDCTAATRVLAGPRVHSDLVDALVEQANGTTGRPVRPGRRRLRTAQQRAPARAGGRLPRAGAGPRPRGSPAANRSATAATASPPPWSPGLHQDDEMIQQEIFGPVITVQRFDDEAAGARVGQRRRVRPGLERVDPRPRPGDAHGPGPRLRLRVDQHPHPARGGDAPRRASSTRATARTSRSTGSRTTRGSSTS